MGSVTEGNGLFIVSHQSHEVKRKPNVRLIVGKGERFLRYLKEEKRRGPAPSIRHESLTVITYCPFAETYEFLA